MLAEQWKTIADFPAYAVSNLGRVMRIVPGGRGAQCRVLKPWLNNKGYECIGLSRDKKNLRRLVHRLVCAAFHGPAPAGRPNAAHNDGFCRNNRDDNLRWASQAENMEDSRKHGTMAIGKRHGRTTKPDRTPRGSKHGHAKLSDKDVAKIRAHPKTTGSGKALATKYGVSPSVICMIRSGKTWKHLLEGAAP